MRRAALRVFGNADGAYGANVNQMVGAGVWNDEDELADAYVARKGFAYGTDGLAGAAGRGAGPGADDRRRHVPEPGQHRAGASPPSTTTSTRWAGSPARLRRARGGEKAAVYIGDQTRGDGIVRSLSEQVSLETRTRALNPKWYEALLKHGYEGVREIDAHVTNTLGWSATTGEVSPWVYQSLAETYVLDPAMRERLAAPEPQGQRQDRQPADRGARSASIGLPMPRRWMRCGAPARHWKTAWKASTWRWPHDRRDATLSDPQAGSRRWRRQHAGSPWTRH